MRDRQTDKERERERERYMLPPGPCAKPQASEMGACLAVTDIGN